MCVGVAETGGINTYAKHCLIPRRPAMIHKVTFLLLLLLHDQKYEKKKSIFKYLRRHQRANPREWLPGVCSFHLFLFYSFAEFYGDCSLNEFYAAPVGKTARLIIIIGKPYRVRTVRITAEDSL